MEQFIRNRTRSTGSRRTITKEATRRWKRLFVRRRKRTVRYSLLTANLCLLVMVVLFVAKTPSQASESSSQKNAIASENADSAGAIAPLDQVSSADIAVTVARTAGLPETVSVTNQADSISLASSQVKASTAVVSKPQVVATALPSKDDIRTYIVKNGDTISSIAAKMGVTSDSIRWSNGLSGEFVTVGAELVIPPSGVNGIVYRVAAGDTPESLAAKFGTNKNLIISFNDAEIRGLRVGERILIPDGRIQPVSTFSSYSAPAATGFAWGGGSPIYGRNGYDYGFCTYYVASRINMPANWGNADTWPTGAAASGWTVDATPRVGAIAWGAPITMHVAYVEAVSDDGRMIKFSDMNNLAGWNAVGYSEWVPASYFPRYISR